MYRILFLVGVGSFIGGVARYLAQRVIHENFSSVIPIGTLAVNIFGCFLIGLFYGLADRGKIGSSEMRIFLATGLCGGFTTFSSFAQENVSLIKDGEFFPMGIYLGISVVAGFAAVHIGVLCSRLF